MDSLKNKNLSFDKISNILTLRYNPNNQSNLKKINWKDYLPKKTVNHTSIKNLLQTSLKKNFLRSFGLGCNSKRYEKQVR